MSRRYYSQEEKKKLKKKLLLLLGGIALFCIAAVVLFQVVDKRQAFGEGELNAEDTVNVVEIGGQKYKPKTRIKTYLFMGIDASGEAEAIGEYNGTGQCDVLQLVVIDQNEDTYAVVPINRDTITDVKSLEDDGTYIATSEIQICLAHAMGDGMEMSCENTVDAVSNYLYGQKIDGYMALNMDAIQVVNHIAGGVTVTIEDDFSKEDPSLKVGETIKLTDEQAEHYVRGRMRVADGTNLNRMKRQSNYLKEAEKIYRQKFAEDESCVLELYDGLKEYMVTNLTKKDCSKLAKAVSKNESLGEITIEGETSSDRFGLNQFVPDEESLEEVVTRLFYEKL